ELVGRIYHFNTPKQEKNYFARKIKQVLIDTERQMLSSIEDIVEKSLPLFKLETHFQDPEAAKLCILKKISFCEVRQKVCSQWKEIVFTMRDSEFKESGEHPIDNFDIMCKEWGFLLLQMFGTSIGTGDYGHHSGAYADAFSNASLPATFFNPGF
ncbi:hypothetical protein P5673_020279, partial [Acropora cervicornis]